MRTNATSHSTVTVYNSHSVAKIRKNVPASLARILQIET